MAQFFGKKIPDQNFEILTGLLVLGLLLFFTLGGYFGKDPLETNNENYILKAEFQTADGIKVSDPVFLAGIRIGHVAAMELGKRGNNALLYLLMTTGILIPADSEIRILSTGISGGKYLSISPGLEDSYLGPENYFEFSQSAVQFEDLLERVVTMAEKRQAEKADAKKNAP